MLHNVLFTISIPFSEVETIFLLCSGVLVIRIRDSHQQELEENVLDRRCDANRRRKADLFLRESRPVSIRNKVTLITGGSRGLGLVLAREFAEREAQVAICARSESGGLPLNTLELPSPKAHQEAQILIDLSVPKPQRKVASVREFGYGTPRLTRRNLAVRLLPRCKR